MSGTSLDERGRRIEHHVGYVKVIKPPRSGGPEEFGAEGTLTYGLWFGAQSGIGYTKQNWLNLPLDCRVVIVVHDKAQLAWVIETLSELEGDTLCATVSAD
jgi:hypothetical protein